jgi:cytoskeletal protein CcmA (bactofilin family)
MLDAAKKRVYGETKVVTIIGQGTTIIGEIKSKGTIRVEGVVSGRIHSEDSIVVQETGRVKADLYAGQVTIAGEVEGNVFAQDRLEIATNGKLMGDIVAPRVSIAEGVLFEGKCTMKPPQAAQPQRPQSGGDSGEHQQGPPRQTQPSQQDNAPRA